MQKPNHEQLPRREFLKKAGLGALSLALISKISGPTNAFANAIVKDAGKEPETAHEENEHFKLVDGLTATAVVGGFTNSVIADGLIKNVPLSTKTASQQIGLALARIAALKTFGGHEGEHLGNEELAELSSPEAIIPIMVLIMLSDMTQDLSVDPNEFIKTNGLVVENLDYTKAKRPDINAGKEVWTEYLAKIDSDLKNQTKNIAAIASVLGLVGTTYASSALSNQLKTGLSRIVYEQSFAKSVLQQEQKGRPISAEVAEAEAVARTDSAINGVQGFSKLALSLYANNAGAAVIGNPPEIYFLMEFAKDPIMMGVNESVGLAFSEFSTLALNAWWLKTLDINLTPSDMKDIISSQATVLKGIAESFIKPDVRKASFGNAQSSFSTLKEALLADGSEQSKKTLEVLESTAHAKMRFAPAEYFSNKAEFLRELVRGNTHTDLVQGMLQKIDRYDGSIDNIFNNGLLTDLMTAFGNKQFGQVKTILSGLEQKIQAGQAGEVARMFEDLLDAQHSFKENTAIIPDASNLDDSETELAQEKVKNIQRALHALVAPQERLTSEDRIAGALKILESDGGKSEIGKQLLATLKNGGSETLQAALKKFSTPKTGEDEFTGAAEISEEISDALMGAELKEAEKVIHPETETHFLSHTAQEVMFALLTQVPSVPAMKSLAKISLYAMVGIKEGVPPTADQLKKVIPIVATMTGAISAVADNVAAYLFGRGVLESFFKDAYGKDVLEKEPKLKAAIVILEKTIAEVAGSLTKVGNGPNFAQKKVQILADNTSPQGIAIDQIDMPMSDTTKNAFASVSSVLTIGGAIAYLTSTVDEMERKRK